MNAEAEELLRSLEVITAKNMKHVISRVRSVRELCELEMEVQEILAVESGQACWESIHRGEVPCGTSNASWPARGWLSAVRDLDVLLFV